MTNEEIIREAQAKIMANGEDSGYSVEQHLRDMDLIEELTKLRIKYREESKCTPQMKSLLSNNERRNYRKNCEKFAKS
jgi:hypothetical protein